MSERWVSTEQKFCKYCKCWVADNKVSWAGHENGVRHKKNVAEKISEIKKKSAESAQAAKDQQHWIRKMEEAALRDYRKKDLHTNSDFTAKLYNNEELPDVSDTYEAIDHPKSNVIGPQIPKALASASAGPTKGGGDRKGGTNFTPKTVDPMMAPTGEAPDRWDRDYDIKMKKLSEASLCPVKAPTTGTKWHNTPAPKMWYEARTEDGNSYFWHVENHESRWDTPPGGFVSIEEQAKVQAGEEAKASKKKKVISEQKQFHRQHEDNPLPGLAGGPGLSPKRDPYGLWNKVEKEAEPSYDLGLPSIPQVKVKAPTLQYEPRQEWKEKTVESLGPVQTATAPAINFRKRKAASLRSREEDED